MSRPSRRPTARRRRQSRSRAEQRPGRESAEPTPALDLLVILRDALASSLVGGLLFARDARASGSAVGVLVTQEALAALAFGTFEWPRELSGQEMRLGLADRGAAVGLPTMGRGEGRQLDPKQLVATARDAGVAVYACPTWASLLGLADSLPDGVRALDGASASHLIRSAKQIVGTL
jgi:peroxiredoxin family protein